jgi:hypothetical protein
LLAKTTPRNVNLGSVRFSMFNNQRDIPAKLPVMLNVPLATHGFTASFAAFGIKQYPFPPSSRLGADSCIVLPEASFEVSRPADIGSAIIFALAPQHINEKEHLVL